MGDFSVDAISKLKNKEMEEQAKAEADNVEKRERQKYAVRAQETSMKQVAANKEKLLKMVEEKEKRILLMKIGRRFEAFPWLEKKIPSLSKNPSLVELRETDELQKLELDLQGSEQRLGQYIKQGFGLLEFAWGDGSKLTFLPEHLRLNLTGIGKLGNSPFFEKEAKPLIKETVIEYPTIGQMSLTFRWINCIFGAMMAVHMSNAVSKQMTENPEQLKQFLRMMEAKSNNNLPNNSPQEEDVDLETTSAEEEEEEEEATQPAPNKPNDKQ